MERNTIFFQSSVGDGARGIRFSVYLVPGRLFGTVLARPSLMLKSQRGKATSEWSAWILAYEHTLRSRYNDLFVNRLDLDLNELRLRCERGDDPVSLANRDVIPLMSSRSRARIAMERQQIMEDIARMKNEKRTRGVQRLCCVLALGVLAVTGYLSYTHWQNVWDMRDQEQARMEWRRSVGLR